MLAAVEVLDTLIVISAQIWFKLALVVFVILIQIEICLQAFLEVDRGEQWIVIDHFIEDVEVEWKLVNRFDTFQKFAAHWASNSTVPKEIAEAGCTECVSAANDDSRNSLSDVELEATEVTEVKLSCCIASSNLWEFEFVPSGGSDA